MWPKDGTLSTSPGQHALLGGVTAGLAVIPLLVGTPFAVAIANLVLVSLLVAVGGLYLARNEPTVWGRFRDLVILSVLVLGVVYGTWGVTMLVPFVPPYLLPIPLAPFLPGPRRQHAIDVAQLVHAEVGAGLLRRALKRRRPPPTSGIGSSTSCPNRAANSVFWRGVTAIWSYPIVRRWAWLRPKCCS